MVGQERPTPRCTESGSWARESWLRRRGPCGWKRPGGGCRGHGRRGWSGRRQAAAGTGARRGSLPGSGLGSLNKTGWTSAQRLTRSSGPRSTSSSFPGSTPRAQPRAAAASTPAAVIPVAHPPELRAEQHRTGGAPPSAPGANSRGPALRGRSCPEAAPTVRTRARGGALSRCPPCARAVRGRVGGGRGSAEPGLYLAEGGAHSEK